ncbi:MAG: DUF3006 domain-containing protein [Acidaminococcaceae bacterium]
MMKIEVTIDRFEGTKAVLLYGEDGISINWPRELLPEGMQEGDVLTINLKKDSKATQKALKQTESLLRELLQQT